MNNNKNWTDEKQAKLILKWLPQNAEQLGYIPGVGPLFMEIYGDKVLKDIKAKKVDFETFSNDNYRNQLRTLYNKLFNFSKNRFINYNKAYKNTHDFIFQGGCLLNNLNDLVNINQIIPLTDLGNNDDAFEFIENNEKIQNKDQKQNGKSNFWLGHKFVTGKYFSKFENKDIIIEAPLVIIPIHVKDGIVSFDENRDIVLNDVFINYFYYTHEMSRNSNQYINSQEILEQVKGNSNQILESVGIDYKRYNLKIIDKNMISSAPILSVSIQQDYLQMIENDHANLLTKQLLGLNENVKNVNGNLDSKKIVNISELSTIAEKIIADIDANDVITIEGPPGTGKSHTITNIISTYLARGLKVCLISEKKTALDVVWNKFKKNKRYSILLDGNQSNKNLLFEQLIQTLENIDKHNPSNINELSFQLEKISEQIEDLFKASANVASKLVKDTNYIKIFKYKDLEEISPSNENWFATNYQNFNKLDINLILEFWNYYNTNQEILDNLYKEQKNWKLYQAIGKKLTKADQIIIKQEYKKVKQFIEDNSSFIKKLFNKNKVEKQINEFMTKHFDGVITTDFIENLQWVEQNFVDKSNFFIENIKLIDKYKFIWCDEISLIKERLEIIISTQINGIEDVNTYHEIAQLFKQKQLLSEQIVEHKMVESFSQINELPKLLKNLKKRHQCQKSRHYKTFSKSMQIQSQKYLICILWLLMLFQVTFHMNMKCLIY